jgi:hypothetical protein
VEISKCALTQEETNSILYQRRQNGWSKKINLHIKVTAKRYGTD